MKVNLCKLQDHVVQHQSLQMTLLCRTLSGLPVPLPTITNFSATDDEIKNRKYIFLSARVHPGETPASFMIDGVIKTLLSSSALARRLRNVAVFKVVPMLNPDGVAVGNHRCNLLGLDLNRQWMGPLETKCPSICHFKRLVKDVVGKRAVPLFCDFHAHSRAENIF